MTRNPGTVGADPDPFPTRPVSAVSGTADESFERQLESVSRFVSQTNPKTEPTVDSTPLETADTHDQRNPPHLSAGSVPASPRLVHVLCDSGRALYAHGVVKSRLLVRRSSRCRRAMGAPLDFAAPSLYAESTCGQWLGSMTESLYLRDA